MRRNSLLAFVMAATVLLSGCAFAFTTAEISEVKVCFESDEKGACANHQGLIPWDALFLYSNVRLSAAPDGTLVRAEWWYASGSYKIDETSIYTAQGDDTIYFSLRSPSKGFPSGDYNLRLYINAEKEASVVNFIVDKGSPNALKPEGQ